MRSVLIMLILRTQLLKSLYPPPPSASISRARSLSVTATVPIRATLRLKRGYGTNPAVGPTIAIAASAGTYPMSSWMLPFAMAAPVNTAVSQ